MRIGCGNSKETDIDLSIVIPVYNHEKYLDHCIESVLMQKVYFTYEVLVGEDCSTDGSRTILKEWEKGLSSNWKILYRNKNLGMTGNGDDLYRRSQGRYLITLEGDDYWTYEHKLQKQYDFLESHPEYIAVAHHCRVVDEEEQPISRFFYDRMFHREYTIRDYYAGYLPGQTATVMMRNFYRWPDFQHHLDPPDYPRDRKKAFILASHGRVRIYPYRWSCYRHVCDHGSSWSANVKKETYDELPFLDSIEEYVIEEGLPCEQLKLIEGRRTYKRWTKAVTEEHKSLFSVVPLIMQSKYPAHGLIAVLQNSIQHIRYVLWYK